ncbi:hypothetical protein AvCA_34030 [Azotobacter vinelandii CA]|uniref:Uncharacterized protein n=2 Tax=Azotobacter vinelandii TaxID=354 RepID=C1DPY2_AZOVD|nr:hypothetical protein [Azotobacter vinelandii]ACO79553.1 hypothetical protein Avin_34030 [Azotobacter vinelandii DJ]AGK14646.1 hypothetical protein AvCA_34030 [Azotobacter vinelandii CA]AGK21320.1 hypothetical protein AvCA6_34030 [Azotobacter vinelandii CA6]
MQYPVQRAGNTILEEPRLKGFGFWLVRHVSIGLQPLPRLPGTAKASHSKPLGVKVLQEPRKWTGADFPPPTVCPVSKRSCRTTSSASCRKVGIADAKQVLGIPSFDLVYHPSDDAVGSTWKLEPAGDVLS